MTLVTESEALHRRVRAFARGDASAGRFDALALDIAAFQARWSPGHRRLLEAAPAAPISAAGIPAVPSAAFRVTRVAVHPEALDERVFVTSGTTSDERGRHALRTTRTYRELSLLGGEPALCRDWPARRSVVALAPRPDPALDSSLGFMMGTFMREWSGAEQWLLGEAGVDVDALTRAARAAAERDEPLIVLATAFALVMLCDALGGMSLATPPRTAVMITGGFKGRTREVDPGALRTDVARALGILAAQIVGEYGMTELSSQLWESRDGPAATYVAPPWLLVTAVDPVTLIELPAGEIGLARFVDLANVDSAVAVVTEDLVRCRGSGVELLGRSAGAPSRGCSLAVEALGGAGTART